MGRDTSHGWLSWGWLFGLTVLAVAIGNPRVAIGQSDRPDFSLIDPAWAAAQIDRSFTNGADMAAWSALKRDHPEEYETFLKTYVRALRAREDAASILRQFFQSHLRMAILLAPFAPSPTLARFQRAKATMIDTLAKSDVDSCAAFAVGDAETLLSNVLGNRDKQILRSAAELDAALIDAAAAARVSPKARRVIDADDIKVFKREALALGDMPEDIDSMLSKMPESKLQRCRLGVLFFQAVAATPDDTAAKFAFK